jgi:hypothetical protein
VNHRNQHAYQRGRAFLLAEVVDDQLEEGRLQDIAQLFQAQVRIDSGQPREGRCLLAGLIARYTSAIALNAACEGSE